MSVGERRQVIECRLVVGRRDLLDHRGDPGPREHDALPTGKPDAEATPESLVDDDLTEETAHAPEGQEVARCEMGDAPHP